MAGRWMSVGETTDASALSDQVKRYKPRAFRQPSRGPAPLTVGGPKSADGAANAAHERLTSKCISVIVDNFEDLPMHEHVPAKYMREITSRLPANLDPNIAATYVFDENYWKRSCIERFGWQNCQIAEHGLTWKQLFFETWLTDQLESFDPHKTEFAALIASVKACQDYVFALTAKQLLAHPDLEKVCEHLPNLTKLDITYGVKKIGMKYERMLFGMKISDANCLARCVLNSPNLTTLVLASNLIDDDLLRMLMTGLIKNSSITYLDVSHNKITNHGVRLLSKLLGSQSVLTSLSLADNQIHAEGGRYLGRGLRSNASLVDLNLRLNRLTDDGGRMLLEGIRSNRTLMRLNISANALGTESAAAIATVLQSPDAPLQTIDLSCNEFGNQDVCALAGALAGNSTLTSVDMRMNEKITEDLDELAAIQAIAHKNELGFRNGQ